VPESLAEEAQATEALDALIVHVEQQASRSASTGHFLAPPRRRAEQGRGHSRQPEVLLAFLDAASGRVEMRSSPPEAVKATVRMAETATRHSRMDSS